MDKKEMLDKILSFLEKDENPDSIEIGTPSKGGAVKIYADFGNLEAAKRKIDNAFEARKYAQEKLGEVK